MDLSNGAKSEDSDKESTPTPLRLVRIGTGQTLEEVSAGTGIDISTISRIEKGESTTPVTAEKLARHFGPALIDEMRILYPQRYMQGAR